MMCQRIGRVPIGTNGFGMNSVCSRSRVPMPPHRMTTFSPSTVLRICRVRSAVELSMEVAFQPLRESCVPPKNLPKRPHQDGDVEPDRKVLQIIHVVYDLLANIVRLAGAD